MIRGPLHDTIPFETQDSLLRWQRTAEHFHKKLIKNVGMILSILCAQESCL